MDIQVPVNFVLEKALEIVTTKKNRIKENLEVSLEQKVKTCHSNVFLLLEC